MARKVQIIFADYYEDWVDRYKRGFVRSVTLNKYLIVIKWIRQNYPRLTVNNIDKRMYQDILNKYAENHERQTVKDFHALLTGCIREAYDEGYLDRDPTRNPIFKGVKTRAKKLKFLNKDELYKLISVFDTPLDKFTYDWFLLMVAKTGMRFGEAAAIAPRDIDFIERKININKTLSYKKATENIDYEKTKNESSVRKVSIDYILCEKLRMVTTHLKPDIPMILQINEFADPKEEGEPRKLPKRRHKRVFNSTVNNVLSRDCIKAGVPEITVHSLRHTHASVLLSEGVSILSISRRLGHSNVSTTQETYLHVIKELEAKDEDKIQQAMCRLPM